MAGTPDRSQAGTSGPVSSMASLFGGGGAAGPPARRRGGSATAAAAAASAAAVGGAGGAGSSSSSKDPWPPYEGLQHGKGQHTFVLRGLYSAVPGEGESEGRTDGGEAGLWRERNWAAVPRRFDTKEESEAYVKMWVRGVCTNPEEAQCDHIFSLLTTWEQVQKYLLDPLASARRRWPVQPLPGTPLRFGEDGRAVGSGDGGAGGGGGDATAAERMLASNMFVGHTALRHELRWRLCLPIHRRLGPEATLNTLRYLFFHMRCGIFVAIRRRTVVMFVPFCNRDYRNTWWDQLKMDANSVKRYYNRKKKSGFREEDVLLDTSKWWANGNIICNEPAAPGKPAKHWADTFFVQLREMLEMCCERREVPDCEFFLNKRDFPHLKANATEPYDFMYDHDDHPLPREKYSTYAPVASFFCSKYFADLPFPPTDDWETATGKVYPTINVDIRSAKNRKQFDVKWSEKIGTAVFRGNATGGGVTPKTNQRLRLAKLSAEWAKNPDFNGEADGTGVRYVDAGVVGWNKRDKKVQGERMRFIDPKKLGLKLVERIPMFEQVKYKYLFYVEGHCAAARYASLMVLGSVILLVESVTKADHLWYFPLLQPFDFAAAERTGAVVTTEDHIVIRQDLGNLAAAIRWLRAHDNQAKRIADNSKAKAERMLGEDGILDYMQLMMWEIAAHYDPTLDPATIAAKVKAAGTGTDEAWREKCRVPDVDWFGPENARYNKIDIKLAPGPVFSEYAHSDAEDEAEEDEAPEPAHVPVAAPSGPSRAAGGASRGGLMSLPKPEPVVKLTPEEQARKLRAEMARAGGKRRRRTEGVMSAAERLKKKREVAAALAKRRKK